MADIYTGGKIQAPIIGAFKSPNMQIGGMLERAGQSMQEQGEKRLNSVEDVYSKELNVIAQNSLSGLAYDPKLSSNPEAMAGAIDKVIGKMSNEIPDNETKLNFLMNMDIKKQSYINHAQANFVKEQEERKKQAYYNSIYGAMDTIGLSLSNGLRGSGNVNDLMNAINGQAIIKQSLESVNSNGKPMFSFTQQQQMKRDVDKVVLDGVKQTIDGMTEDEAQDFYTKVKDNNFVVGQVEGKNVMLQDVLGDKTYSDVKRYAMNRRLQDLSIKKKQDEIDARQSMIDFELNPTETNYEDVLKLNPNLSETQRDRIDSIWKASPNYEATTKFATKAQALDYINELSTKDESEMEDAMLKTVEKLVRSQVAGNLTVEDLDEMKVKLRDVALDPEMKKIYAMTSQKYKDTFMDFILNNLDKEEKRAAEISRSRKEKGAEITQKIENTALQQRMDLLGKDYMKKRSIIEADKSLSTDEKIEEINRLTDDTRKEIIYFKNPDVKGKEIGSIIKRNGILYSYEGMTNDDIILKIVR